MNEEKEVRISIGKLTFILIITLVLVAGGSYAFWSWESLEEQWSNVAFVVQEPELGYSCSADGGGAITAGEAVILPATCESSGNVIVREITTNVEIDTTGVVVSMDLWLNVNELGTGLSNSQNFKYVVTDSATSCTSGVLASGNFNGKSAGDTVNILNLTDISSSSTNKYYLYIWLDEAETDVATANQTFDLSLGGTCVGELSSLTAVTLESYSCANENSGSEP